MFHRHNGVLLIKKKAAVQVVNLRRNNIGRRWGKGVLFCLVLFWVFLL